MPHTGNPLALQQRDMQSLINPDVLQILILTIQRVRYEFDDERNRSTPAVRPKGRSAKPPSGLLAMSFYAPSVYRMPMAAPTDCTAT